MKTYENEMIFRRFYLFLVLKWIKNWRKKDRFKRKYLKLFICPYCLNFWITTIAFVSLYDSINILPIVIGLSYLSLEIIIKIISYEK